MLRFLTAAALLASSASANNCNNPNDGDCSSSPDPSTSTTTSTTTTTEHVSTSTTTSTTTTTTAEVTTTTTSTTTTTTATAAAAAAANTTKNTTASDVAKAAGDMMKNTTAADLVKAAADQAKAAGVSVDGFAPMSNAAKAVSGVALPDCPETTASSATANAVAAAVSANATASTSASDACASLTGDAKTVCLDRASLGTQCIAKNAVKYVEQVTDMTRSVTCDPTKVAGTCAGLKGAMQVIADKVAEQMNAGAGYTAESPLRIQPGECTGSQTSCKLAARRSRNLAAHMTGSLNLDEKFTVRQQVTTKRSAAAISSGLGKVETFMKSADAKEKMKTAMDDPAVKTAVAANSGGAITAADVGTSTVNTITPKAPTAKNAAGVVTAIPAAASNAQGVAGSVLALAFASMLA